VQFLHRIPDVSAVLRPLPLADMSSQAPEGEQLYAGQRLGLPEHGPGSVASWGRRIAALFLDWIASSLVASVIASFADVSTDTERLLPLLVFLAEVSLFTGIAGASFGQLALRVVVVRVDGGPVTILHAVVRTVLICLVIPPVVFNRDNRGLHDLAAGTITLNR
jgi:uncharacterized RDD family membrane protein YckC